MLTEKPLFIRTLAPEAEGSSTPPADPAPPAPAEPPVEPAAPQEPQAPAGDTPPWGEDFDPERAWKRIQAQKADLDAERAKREKAVKDAEAAAEQRAREEAYREFGKHLGLVKDDEPPTVEGLQQALQEKDSTLTAAQAEAQALRIENAILRYADKHGGDADALTDSESFKSKLKALDPTADDYASQVEQLVKTAVESNARFRKVQVAPRSSNGNPAPSGGDTAPKDDIETLRATYRKERGVN